MPAQEKPLAAISQRDCGYQPEGRNEPLHRRVPHIHFIESKYPHRARLAGEHA